MNDENSKFTDNAKQESKLSTIVHEIDNKLREEKVTVKDAEYILFRLINGYRDGWEKSKRKCDINTLPPIDN